MTNENQIAQLDRSIAESNRLIELSKVLERLESNRDFKKIVQEMYLKDEAVRLVHLKADPNMQYADKQAKIVRDIDAIGSFAMFLSDIHIRARMAHKTVADDEDTRSELMNGDFNV